MTKRIPDRIDDISGLRTQQLVNCCRKAYRSSPDQVVQVRNFVSQVG
jgi:hypothetical protein